MEPRTPLHSDIFPVETITLAGRTEHVLRGGRHLFDRLPHAFTGIARIGVIGWGSQAAAQSQNLRESLAGTGIEVVVGLRAGSPSRAAARAAGFVEEDGTLGDVIDVIGSSDLVLLLIADAALAGEHETLFAALRPGATVGLSHGFLVGHLASTGGALRADVDVIGVCPKGMGPSVRRLYEQGRDDEGAGINASVAIHKDVSGRATERALGWAVAIGAPFVFATTLDAEYRSDVVGERAVLLGGLHGLVEALYRRFVELGDPADRAFTRACECLTGPIARQVSRRGLRGVYDALSGDDRRTFEEAYAAVYPVALALVEEIYDEVASGIELRSVLLAGERLRRRPMPAIDGAGMWRVGAGVRAAREDRSEPPIDPTTAGAFCALMTAQVDHFAERGHEWSEIANESVIEVVDSLIPFMHARGVAAMVDGCSTTARLGARKWGPRFESQLHQVAFPTLDRSGETRSEQVIEAFKANSIHEVLAVLVEYRPKVDISVS